MAVTNDQLQAEIDAINKVLNQLQVVVTNLASKQQLNQLNTLRQTDITDLQTRVTSLETSVALLKTQI